MISGSGKSVASRQLKSDAVDGGEERTGVARGDLPEGGGGLVFISFCCSATVRSKQGRSRGHWWEKSNSWNRRICACAFQAFAAAFSQIAETLHIIFRAAAVPFNVTPQHLLHYATVDIQAE